MDDRVNDYLDKMDGLTVEDMLDGSILLKSPRKHQQNEIISAKQMQIVDSTRNKANQLISNQISCKLTSNNYLFLLEENLSTLVNKTDLETSRKGLNKNFVTQIIIPVVDQRTNKSKAQESSPSIHATSNKLRGPKDKFKQLVKQQTMFRLNKNEKLHQYFREIVCAGFDRLTKARLVDLLSSRYPSGQPSMADTMVKQLWIFLENSGQDLKFDKFCEKLEKFINQDEVGIKRFLFEIFDTLNCDKITDESLFRFMTLTTKNVPGFNPNPIELMSLKDIESDMFLQLFSSDFCKIQNALAYKTKQKFGRLNLLKLQPDQNLNYSTSARTPTKTKKSPKKQQLQEQKQGDNTAYLTFEDFCQIDFGLKNNERPLIVNDLIWFLSGVKSNYIKHNKETDEHNKKVIMFPTPGNDEELASYFESMNETCYKSIERAFKLLWGWRRPENVQPDSDMDGIPYLTERNFTKNIKFVINQESEFFGKLLYLYFSNGKDKYKVTIQRFFEGLKTYTDESDKLSMHKTSFSILDLDNDGKLNVINLLHLQKNIPSNTKLGQELFRVLEWWLDKNNDKISTRHKFEVSFEVYFKINQQKMCLTQEMRTCFLGQPGKQNEGEPTILAPSILNYESDDLEELEEQKLKSKTGKGNQIKQGAQTFAVYESVLRPIQDPDFVDMSLGKKYALNDFEVIEEVSMGQRGFNKNLDRLTNQLIAFYKKKFPLHANQCFREIAQRQEEKEYLQRVADRKQNKS